MTSHVVQFPIYGITALDQVRVALCGGGGAMKSGVPNLVEVYDTRGGAMTLTHRYDCDRVAPACIASHPGEPILAVGLDHVLLILRVEKIRKTKGQDKVTELTKVVDRDVVRVTDKAEMIKGISFCCFGEKLVTVGEDMAVNIWEFPSMVRRWTITQHLSEVTQITAHPMGEPEIITSTRGSQCSVWDVESGQLKQQLKYAGPVANAKYRYRNIRYNTSGEVLYAVIVPLAWTRTCSSHIVKYTCASWEITTQSTVRGEPLSELAVSAEDRFIATSSSNGHVYVFDGPTLALRRRVFEAHGLFVTGLCFTNYGSEESGLLSVSADRGVKYHNPHIADPARILRVVLIFIGIFGILYLIYNMVSDYLPLLDDFEEDQTEEHEHQHSHHNEL